jgi:hypothetical protein
MRVRRTRILAALLAVAVGTAAAPLVPATAAHAATSGAGWSGSWDYYTTDAYRYTLTLPGVRVLGFSSDTGGRRFGGASLEDTEADGRCAQVQMYGQRNGDLALLADRTVCDGEAYEAFTIGSFTGAHQIYIGRLDPSAGFQDKFFSMIVPGSDADPELREFGTGSSWEYTTAQAYGFSLVRHGVKVTGSGIRQSADARSLNGVVEHTGAPDTCAYAEATDFFDVSSVMSCTPGSNQLLYSARLISDILVQACQVTQSWRCVEAWIPDPF